MQETHSSTLAQYLEEIQRENFRENYSSIVELASMNSTVNMLISSQEDLLPERVEARAKLKEESLRQTIRNTVARFPSDEEYPVPLWSIDLWGELMGALSAEQNSALANTQRTVLYGREANGWTIFHPDGRILAIDIALNPIFFYMNQAAYLAKQRAERDNGLLEEFFRAVLAPYPLYFVAFPPPASLPATRGMTKAAYLLLKSTTRDQLRFVAAHEIGHALLGHSWGDRRPAGPPGSTADAEEAAHGRDMEYAADGFALDLVTGLCLKNSQLDQIHAAGAETEDQKNRLAEELIRTMDPLSLSLHLLFVFFRKLRENGRLSALGSGRNAGRAGFRHASTGGGAYWKNVRERIVGTVAAGCAFRRIHATRHGRGLDEISEIAVLGANSHSSQGGSIQAAVVRAVSRHGSQRASCAFRPCRRDRPRREPGGDRPSFAYRPFPQIRVGPASRSEIPSA